MSLIEFMAQHAVVTLFTVLSCSMIVYCAYCLFNDNRPGVSVLLSCSMLTMIYLFSQSYVGALNGLKTNTLVVMPNKQNLRLGQDGKLSFCINGMARDWEKTEDGVISSQARFYRGKPMKCLSVEDSIVYLGANGASETDLDSMRAVYGIYQ